MQSTTLNHNKLTALKELAEECGLTLISQTYSGSGATYEFICPIHRIIRISADNLKQKRRCPECGKIKGRTTKNLAIFTRLTQTAMQANLTMLSTEYVHAPLKYKLACSIHGVIEMSRISLMVHKCCIKCKDEASGLTRLRNLATESNLILHSSSYSSCEGMYDFECPIHGYITMRMSVLQQSRRCHKCGKAQSNSARCIPANEIALFVKSLGLTLDISTYKNTTVPATLYCPTHGKFYRTIENLRSRPYCPGCVCGATSYGEIRCLEVIEKLTHRNFIKARIIPYAKSAIELDLYNKDVRLAIEYNGMQHYCEIPFLQQNASLAEIQTRDRFKITWCRDHGIYLIVVPYTVKLEEIEQFIIDALPLPIS